MQIILIRHGQAEALATTDAERILTPVGEWQAQQTAAWLANQGYQLDGLFASPYKRAQQTARYVEDALDIPLTTCKLLTPDSDPVAMVNWLDQLDLPDNSVIALVCHMPIVGRLASYFLTGSAKHDLGFYLAEAKIIDSVMLAPGLGKTRIQFVPPTHPL